MDSKIFCSVVLISIFSAGIQECHCDDKLLIIMLDGFRWDYFNINGLKGIPRLLKMGVKAEYMKPVMPTSTFPNFYAVMTGNWPEENGMVWNYMYDPKYKQRFDLGMSAKDFQSFWWEEGEPIWITAEKQGKKAYMYLQFGCEATIHGIKPTYCDPYPLRSPSVNESQNALNRSLADIKNGKADIALVYFEAVDHYGHLFGPFSEVLNYTVLQVDSVIDTLLDQVKDLGLEDTLNVIMWSDHGMEQMYEHQVVNLTHYYDSSDVMKLTETLLEMDKGPLTNIWPVEGKMDTIYNAIKNVEHITVYKKEDLPQAYHVKNNDRTGPIVIVAEPGWSILTHAYPLYPRWEGNGRSGIYEGHHGYDYKLKNMRASFMAFGPSFKKNIVIPPFQNMDLYNLFCSLLKINPAKNSGDSRSSLNTGLVNSSAKFEQSFLFNLTLVLLSGMLFYHYN